MRKKSKMKYFFLFLLSLTSISSRLYSTTHGNPGNEILKQLYNSPLETIDHAFQQMKPHDKKRIANTRINFETTTILHDVVSKDKYELAQILIKNGAEVNKKDCYGQTPLHVATQKRNFKIMHLLLLHEADVNAQDTDHQETCLHKLLKQFLQKRTFCMFDAPLLNLILEQNINYSLTDENGNSVVHLAAQIKLKRNCDFCYLKSLCPFNHFIAKIICADHLTVKKNLNGQTPLEIMKKIENNQLVDDFYLSLIILFIFL